MERKVGRIFKKDGKDPCVHTGELNEQAGSCVVQAYASGEKSKTDLQFMRNKDEAQHVEVLRLDDNKVVAEKPAVSGG